MAKMPAEPPAMSVAESMVKKGHRGQGFGLPGTAPALTLTLSGERAEPALISGPVPSAASSQYSTFMPSVLAVSSPGIEADQRSPARSSASDENPGSAGRR